MDPPSPDRDAACAAAAAIGLAVPEACLPGVVADRALLDRHLATLEDALARHPEA